MFTTHPRGLIARLETGEKVPERGFPKCPQLRLHVSSNIVAVPVGLHCTAQWRTVSHLVHAQRQPMPRIWSGKATAIVVLVLEL